MAQKISDGTGCGNYCFVQVYYAYVYVTYTSYYQIHFLLITVSR